MAMTLVFIDGFDHYTNLTDMLRGKWNNGSAATIASPGRSGAGSHISVNTSLRKTISGSEFVIGIGFKYSSPGDIITLFDVTNNKAHIILRVDPGTNKLEVRYGASLTVLGTTVLSAGTWHYAELATKVDDAAGSVRVHLDGVSGSPEIDISSVDTRNGSSGVVEELRPGGAATAIDDLYLKTGTGWTTADFFGDVRVDTKYPNGPGAFAQMTPVGAGANWDCQSEAAMNEDTDYVESAAAGERDSYVFEDLPTTVATIHAVQVTYEAEKVDAVLRQSRQFARIGGANYDNGVVDTLSLTQYLTFSRMMVVSPATSSAWTRTEFNAAEFGEKSEV